MVSSTPRSASGRSATIRAPAAEAALAGTRHAARTIRMRRNASLSCSEPHRLADELFHDLVRPGVDAADARVDPRLADRVLRRVAVAAVELDAGVGDLAQQVGRPPLRHRRLLDRAGPGDVALDAAVDEAAGDLDFVLSSASVKRECWNVPIGRPKALRSLT